MEIVSLIGAIQSIFFFFLLLVKKQKSRSDYWLLFLLFLWFIELVYIYLSGEKIIEETSLINWFLLGLPILSPIVFYFYVISFTNAEYESVFKSKIHFLHLVILYISAYIVYLIASNEPFADQSQRLLNVYVYFVRMYVVVLAISYFTMSLVEILNYQKRIKESISNIENINLNWLKLLVTIGLISVAISSTAYILVSVTNYDVALLNFIIGFFATIWIFIIGFKGLRQGNIFAYFSHYDLSYIQQLQSKESGIHKFTLSDDSIDNYKIKLNRIMEEEKPYLKPDLSISELAGKCQIPINHLSYYINEYEQKNFFDFINEYRLKELVRKLGDPSLRHITILGLAYDSGFNSKSSFNRIFKKYFQLTPSAYKNQVLIKN